MVIIQPPNYVNNSEEYNGTTWSEGNDLATARGNGIGGCRNSNCRISFLLVMFTQRRQEILQIQKNMMVHLGQRQITVKTARFYCCNAGTQTASYYGWWLTTRT